MISSIPPKRRYLIRGYNLFQKFGHPLLGLLGIKDEILATLWSLNSAAGRTSRVMEEKGKLWR